MYTRFLPLLLLVGSSLASSRITGQIFLTNQTVPLDISSRILLGGRDGYEQLGEIYGPEEPISEYHFSFPAPVPSPGDYVLRIESRKYEFQKYFVKVGQREEEPVQVALFDDKTLKMLPGTWLPHPLSIHPLRLYPLVEAPAPSMSLVEILKSNPLIWLMGLGLVLMLAIPKLMENLDEETLKEVRESQKEMHQNMASLQNFDSSKFSKFLAGGGATGEIPDLTTVKAKQPSGSPVADTSATGASKHGGSGGKAKKRR